MSTGNCRLSGIGICVQGIGLFSNTLVTDVPAPTKYREGCKFEGKIHKKQNRFHETPKPETSAPCCQNVLLQEGRGQTVGVCRSTSSSSSSITQSNTTPSHDDTDGSRFRCLRLVGIRIRPVHSHDIFIRLHRTQML